MSSLPSPPFVTIEGIHNFRSIGGYPTSNPTSTTRQNFIFRSAEPSKVTPAGVDSLKAHKITTIFDLRSIVEIEKMKAITPIVEIEGVERVYTPVYQYTDYSPEAIAIRYKDYTSNDGTEGFQRAYLDIMKAGAGAYRKIFLHLRDKPDEACLIHCTAGKDRTGVIIALLLQLVGVEDKVIAQEYALTEMGLASWKEIILDHLMQEVGLKVGREGVERMISAR